MKITLTPSRELQIELTRTNLLALLVKLDGHPPGSACTIGKNGVYVKAVEDSEHYANRHRGVMHPDTEEAIAHG